MDLKSIKAKLWVLSEVGKRQKRIREAQRERNMQWQFTFFSSSYAVVFFRFSIEKQIIFSMSPCVAEEILSTMYGGGSRLQLNWIR